MRLTERDIEILMKAVYEKSGKPNKELISAMKLYKETNEQS